MGLRQSHDTAQPIGTSELPGSVYVVRLSEKKVSCILRQSSGSVLQNKFKTSTAFINANVLFINILKPI